MVEKAGRWSDGNARPGRPVKGAGDDDVRGVPRGRGGVVKRDSRSGEIQPRVGARCGHGDVGDAGNLVKENACLAQVNGCLNVTSALLERDDSGAVRLGAFDLSHKTHGRLLSVDADGNVSFYDQIGNAMDASAHVDALLGGSGAFAAPGAVKPGVVDRTM